MVLLGQRPRFAGDATVSDDVVRRSLIHAIMADEPLFTFYGAALTGKKPQHKVSVPAGRMLLLKQAALGPKPPANARATLSVQCDEYPQLVLCTHRMGCWHGEIPRDLAPARVVNL